MKAIEVLKRVDRSKENIGYVGDEFLSDLMGRELYYYGDNPRLQVYYLAPWYCTDTWVGADVYYLDDRPLAYSFQSARKSKPVFQYVDRDVHRDAREYVATLVDDVTTVKFIDPEEDFPETYRVGYREQLLTDRGYVDGRAVMYDRVATREWLEANRSKMSSYGFTFPGADSETYKESIIVIEYADETQEAIDIARFEIPLRIV